MVGPLSILPICEKRTWKDKVLGVSTRASVKKKRAGGVGKEAGVSWFIKLDETCLQFCLTNVVMQIGNEECCGPSVVRHILGLRLGRNTVEKVVLPAIARLFRTDGRDVSV